VKERPKTFPIMQGTFLKAIPWEAIALYEAQAHANHGQSLQTLAARGGLSPHEAMAVIRGWKWPSREDPDMEWALIRWLSVRQLAVTPGTPK